MQSYVFFVRQAEIVAKLLTLQPHLVIYDVQSAAVIKYNDMIPCIFNLGTGEVILIVFVLLLLFGGRKIPELMKGLGKGVRSFKQGMNEITDELNAPAPPSDDKRKQESADEKK